VSKQYDLNIFTVLNHIDRKDRSYFNTLTEKQQKAFQPLVAMMWMGCTDDKQQLYLLNETVNPYIFALHQHKELLYKLLTVASSGKVKRYKWSRKKKAKQSSIPIEIISQYYNCNLEDAEYTFALLEPEEIVEMAEDLGYDKEEVTKLKKILKR
jgi:peptide subunit release factor RF-3